MVKHLPITRVLLASLFHLHSKHGLLMNSHKRKNNAKQIRETAAGLALILEASASFCHVYKFPCHYYDYDCILMCS